eukprot:scaffold66861_cov17-Prasinocladus_malaysianus.AAC.1
MSDYKPHSTKTPCLQFANRRRPRCGQSRHRHNPWQGRKVLGQANEISLSELSNVISGDHARTMIRINKNSCRRNTAMHVVHE